MDIQTQDGILLRGIPDGTPDDVIKARLVKIRAQADQTPGVAGSVSQGALNLLSGGIRGAGSIGATLLAPLDMAKDALAGKGLSLESNRERRASMDSALQNFGAQPDSLIYQGGRLGSEIAGTAGVGGVLAKGATALGAAPKIAAALQSGGLNLGGSGGSAIVNGLARVGAGATVGGASAGLVNPEDAPMGAAIGGAVPVVAKTAGMLGKALNTQVSPDVAALYQKAKDLGIDIPADRIANSKPLNAVAASLNYVPLSGRAGTEARMGTQMNRALSRTFGQDSENVTAALRKAGGALGGEFDRVLKGNAVTVDDAFLNALGDVEASANRTLGKEALRPIKSQIEEILAKGASGSIDGQAAYNIKRELDTIAGGSGTEAKAARDMKKALMDALNRSIGPEEAGKFALVRKQYGNMLDLENLAQNGAEGGVSVGRLANLKHIGNPELQDLADIAAQFLKTREAPHGAAQRVVLGALGAGAAGATGTLPALGVGIGVGRAANTALNSQLAKTLLLNQPENAARLKALGANPVARAALVQALSRPANP